MQNNTNYSCLSIWKMLCVDTIFKMAAVVGLLLLQIGLFAQNKWCSMGENAFHMVFQERWVFSHSSPNPAFAATRLWAGYGELVGENSISPGKSCEMHIVRPVRNSYLVLPGWGHMVGNKSLLGLKCTCIAANTCAGINRSWCVCVTRVNMCPQPGSTR